jgi:mRNA interferase HigB
VANLCGPWFSDNACIASATATSPVPPRPATPADLKRAVRSVSILGDGRAVFNVAGNKYRIVVWINYPYRVVYIRFIGTHRQYDVIDAQAV